MIINLLTGSRATAETIAKHLKKFLGENISINTLLIGNANALSRDILEADLWITDIWNPEKPDDPEGFRTLRQLSRTPRILLLFYAFYPEELGEEGPFWISLTSKKPLFQKVREVMDADPPGGENLQKLIEKWHLLGKDPMPSHGHGHNYLCGH